MPKPIFKEVGDAYEAAKEGVFQLRYAYGALTVEEKDAEYRKAIDAIQRLREIAATYCPNDELTHITHSES